MNAINDPARSVVGKVSLDCPDCFPQVHDGMCDGPRHYRCPDHRARKLAVEGGSAKRWVSWSTFRNGSSHHAEQSRAHLLADPATRRAACGVRIPAGGLAEDGPKLSGRFRNVFDDPESDTRHAAVCTRCQSREDQV